MASAKDKEEKESTQSQQQGKAKEPTPEEKLQAQADHLQAVYLDMEAIATDPASTPEDVAEATNTIEDMRKHKKRLAERHGVTPTTV